jgi:hypothetical protein
MNTHCLGAAERACFEALNHGSGFRFSGQVQHAWCARRAVNEGLLTLSILRPDVRLSLLAAWVRSADSLLDFIARELPDPSVELAICRFEQLALRAHRASISFEAPDPARFDSQRVLRRADAAGLVCFPDGPALLVAPGLRSLCRVATSTERRVWALSTTPCRAGAWIEAGLSRPTIQELLQVGALELAC